MIGPVRAGFKPFGGQDNGEADAHPGHRARRWRGPAGRRTQGAAATRRPDVPRAFGPGAQPTARRRHPGRPRPRARARARRRTLGSPRAPQHARGGRDAQLRSGSGWRPRPRRAPRPVLVHPVDHPLVSAATVDGVVAALRAGAAIAVPTHDGRRGHPTGFAAPTWAPLRGPPPWTSAHARSWRRTRSGSRPSRRTKTCRLGVNTLDDLRALEPGSVRPVARLEPAVQGVERDPERGGRRG